MDNLFITARFQKFFKIFLCEIHRKNKAILISRRFFLEKKRFFLIFPLAKSENSGILKA